MNDSQSWVPSPKKSTVTRTTVTVRLRASTLNQRSGGEELLVIRLIRQLCLRCRATLGRFLLGLLFRHLVQLVCDLVAARQFLEHLEFPHLLGRVTEIEVVVAEQESV